MKKKFLISLIAIFALVCFMLNGKAQAYTLDENIEASIGDKAQLDKGNLGFYSIQKKKSDGTWIYLTYSIINYNDENGKKHIAYCLDESLFGVGYVKGDVDTYQVELKEMLNNEKIWRVITNGYPYKTPEQLGVETEDDAYLATKRAVYSMVSGYTVNDVRENYRVGQTVINGQSLEDIQRRGEKVINAICNLVEIGNNGKQTMNNQLKINKIGELECNEERTKYYQKYKVNSNIEIAEYEINKISNFPETSRIIDENGIEKNKFKANENFYIEISKENIVDDFEGNIQISAKCKTYPVYYAEAPEGYQNYAICSGYWDKLETSTNLNIKVNKSRLKIKKIDEDTKEELANIKFEIKKLNGEIVGEYITNERGEILIDDLKPDTYIIKEIETIEGYILNEEEKIVTIGFDEEVIIEIENKKIPKASLEIVKKDAETKAPISGVEFNVKYEEGEEIGNFVTNQDGKIEINDLEVKPIIVKEVSVPEGYKIDEAEYRIELEDNKTFELEIFNEKIAEEPTEEEIIIDYPLPRTGEDNLKKSLIFILWNVWIVSCICLKKY